MKSIFLLFIQFVTLTACSNLEFVLNDNEYNNPIHNKTSITITGDEIPKLSNIVLTKFGTTQNGLYNLNIGISEKKIKTVIKINQVSTKIDYEIVFNYSLINNDKKCIILTKKQYSRFSFIPKSEGYNFGSDKFLESLYVRNIKENINRFIKS